MITFDVPYLVDVICFASFISKRDCSGNLPLVSLNKSTLKDKKPAQKNWFEKTINHPQSY